MLASSRESVSKAWSVTNGEQEDHLNRAGYGPWTLHLLADEMVRLDIVDAISDETVRKVRKKTA